MAESYEEAIAQARKRYRENMQESAADVLLIVRVHRKARATVCKDIAGEEGWNALDHAARKIEKTAGQTAAELRAAQEARTRKRQEQAVRKAVTEDPDFVMEALGKVSGQTRSTSPSNKAKVEQAFGPEEFNRLEDAIADVLERLPDLAPNKEDKTYANELADKAETIAAILRDWAKGEDIGQEVEAWLEAK